MIAMFPYWKDQLDFYNNCMDEDGKQTLNNEYANSYLTKSDA